MADGLTAQIINYLMQYYQNQSQKAARLTQGPFHTKGGIDVAAGGSIGLQNPVGIVAESSGPIVKAIQSVLGKQNTVRLYRGEAIPKNAEEAAEWAEKALERNHRGGWYTADLDLAKWYADQASNAGERATRVKFIDLPADVADSFRAGPFHMLPEQYKNAAKDFVE